MEYGRPMTADEIAEAIRLDNSMEAPLPTTREVLAWAEEVGALKSDGLIDDEQVDHFEFHQLDRSFAGAVAKHLGGISNGLALAGMISLVRALLPHSHCVMGPEAHTLLRPGLNKDGIIRLLNTLGQAAKVANLAERMAVSTWPEDLCVDIGRTIRILVNNPLQHDPLRYGPDWAMIARARTKPEGNGALVFESSSFASLIMSDFPFAEWVGSFRTSDEVFFPDALFAAMIFNAPRQFTDFKIRISGYCGNENERDGLHLILESNGIPHELTLGDVQGMPTIRLDTAMVFAAYPGDENKALHYAKQFLLRAKGNISRSQRLFLVCPYTCLMNQGEWAVIRSELLKEDLIDSVIHIPKSSKDEGGDPVLMILDNNKREFTRNQVHFVYAKNNIHITNEKELLDTDTNEEETDISSLTKHAFLNQLSRIARERSNALGVSTTASLHALSLYGSTLVPRIVLLLPFAVIDRHFRWDQFSEFRMIRELIHPIQTEEPSREDIVTALLPEVALQDYVQHELKRPYISEQLDQSEKAWQHKGLLPNCFIRVPSLGNQQKAVDDRERSWGLLPQSKVDKEWVTNLVEAIQARTDSPEECTITLEYIINELQRIERKHALEDAEDAFKGYKHDIGSKVGKVRDRIGRLRRNFNSNSSTGLPDDLIQLIQKTLQGSDEFMDANDKMLSDLEKVFSSERYQMEVVDLREMVNEVVQQYKDHPGLTFHNDVGVAHAWADRHKLMRCIENMIQNAIRHGKINDLPLVIWFDDFMDDKHADSVYLLTGNNGKPLDMPFSELIKRGARSSESVGTGLGLHMVRKWIEGMGGSFDNSFDVISYARAMTPNIHPRLNIVLPLRLLLAPKYSKNEDTSDR